MALCLVKVRKRRKPEPPEVAADDDTFYKDMKELLDDEEHMDAIFLVQKRISSQDTSNNKNRKMIGSNAFRSSDPPDTTIPTDLIEIKAHKSVLTARCQYFKAFFRTNASSNNSGSRSSRMTTSAMSSYDPFPNASKNFRVKGDTSESNPTPNALTSTTGATQIPVLAFKEAGECVVHVDPAFAEQHVRVALEFIYTNRITKIRDISTNDLLSLLRLSDMWLLRDMTRLVEHELIRNHMSTSTIVQMYGATEQLSAKRLSHACVLFIMNNLRHLAGNTVFMEEMQHYPLLCIPVLKAAAELLSDGPLNKKQRTALSLSASAVGNAGEHHGSNQHNHHSSGGAPSGSNNHSNKNNNNNNINIAAALRSSPVPDSDT